MLLFIGFPSGASQTAERRGDISLFGKPKSSDDGWMPSHRYTKPKSPHCTFSLYIICKKVKAMIPPEGVSLESFSGAFDLVACAKQSIKK